MKKLLIYSSIIWAVFAVSSCTREPFPGQETGTGDGTCIDLRVKSSEPITKAFPAGEDAYNENVVYTLDYFIFTADPTTSTTAEAFTYGRFTYDTAVKPVDEESSKAAGKVVDLMDFHTAGNTSGYVYVIANLPDKTNSPDNYFEVNAEGKLQQVVGSKTTVLTPNYATLQALEVVASFQKLTDGKFTAQNRFVMAGLQSFTLSGKQADPVTVELSRIASKLSLDMNVIKYLAQFTSDASATQNYQNSWFPNVEKIQVYVNYVNPKGLVSGTYENRKYEIGSYFSYDRYAFIPSIDPNGTYKEKVLSFDEDGNVEYGSDGLPVFVDGNEYPAYNVTGSPFYSYPTTWNASDATAPFIKIIIPWVAYDITDENYQNPTGNNRTALIAAAAGFPEELKINNVVVGERDLERTTPGDMESRGGHEFYYKINIPATLPGQTSVNALQANYWYKLILDIAVLGSDAEDLPVELAGDYYVVDWSAPAEKMGGDLNAGRYFKVNKTFEMFGSELVIPVQSSHNITVDNVSSQYNRYTGNSSTGSLTRHNTLSTGDNFTLIASGRNKVTLTHTVESDLTKMQARDISPITYTFTIQQADNSNYKETVTVIQYPTIYAESIPDQGGASTFLYGTVYSNTARPVTNDDNDSLGNIGNSSAGKAKTIITIKTLAGISTTPYTDQGIPAPVIGDPRASLAEAYLTNPRNSSQVWQAADFRNVSNILEYKYADPSKKNVIAPKIMVASGYGGNNRNAKNTWLETAERCAAYQEDGYPAGRWRLPTEAEVLFIYTLAQTNNLLPNPFYSRDNRYWGNAGRSIYRGSFDDSNNNASCRCVYDLWYWGDDRLDAPNSWGGFKTGYIHNN